MIEKISRSELFRALLPVTRVTIAAGPDCLNYALILLSLGYLVEPLNHAKG